MGRKWVTEESHKIVQHGRDSPKVNVLCDFTEKGVRSLFVSEKTFTGITYLNLLQNSVFAQLETDSKGFIFQQGGAPQHWSLYVKEFLNDRLSRRWIGTRRKLQETMGNRPIRKRILERITGRPSSCPARCR